MTDSELITLIRSSPEKGYRALVKIYGNYVYAVVMNRVRNIAAETDVQECVSDVFIEILKKAQNLDEGQLTSTADSPARIPEPLTKMNLNSLSVMLNRKTKLSVNLRAFFCGVKLLNLAAPTLIY